MLSVEQQLDLYTSLRPPKWLEEHLAYQENPVAFMNHYRGRWAFTDDDVTRYLEANPFLMDGYLTHCHAQRNSHDKVLLGYENGVYLVYWVDNDTRRFVEKFTNKLEAAVRWLKYRYMQ